MELDPRFACECELEANIAKIYDHGLGLTCGNDEPILGGSGEE